AELDSERHITNVAKELEKVFFASQVLKVDFEEENDKVKEETDLAKIKEEKDSGNQQATAQLNEHRVSTTQAQEQHDITRHYFEDIKKTLENVSKNTESVVKRLDKTAHDAVQTSINLINQRDLDIEKAKECKKRQLKNYQLYHKAVKSMDELKSGEVDQHVGSIYCDGHDWLTESIARWEEENKKAEAEIRKLEWQFKN
ncbi:unnamed protein product, partial [Aureobasidium uvarum]